MPSNVVITPSAKPISSVASKALSRSNSFSPPNTSVFLQDDEAFPSLLLVHDGSKSWWVSVWEARLPNMTEELALQVLYACDYNLAKALEFYKLLLTLPFGHFESELQLSTDPLHDDMLTSSSRTLRSQPIEKYHDLEKLSAERVNASDNRLSRTKRGTEITSRFQFIQFTNEYIHLLYEKLGIEEMESHTTVINSSVKVSPTRLSSKLKSKTNVEKTGINMVMLRRLIDERLASRSRPWHESNLNAFKQAYERYAIIIDQISTDCSCNSFIE
jgi:hypothetical protein